MARRDRPIDTFELARVNDERGPRAAADRARQLLEAGRLPEDTTRGELRTELAELLQMAGDLDGAEQVLRELVRDSDRGWCDPRILLAEIQLLRGDTAGSDHLLAEVWAARSTDALDYLTASEVLEGRGDAAGALRWVNSGAFRLRQPEDELLARDTMLLLQRRRRLREEMGFPPDDFDDLAEEAALTSRDEWEEEV